MQSIILLSTGTNKGGGYFAPRGVFLCMYIGLTISWAVLNSFAIQVIAFIDVISIWWQVSISRIIFTTYMSLIVMFFQSNNSPLFEIGVGMTHIHKI